MGSAVDVRGVAILNRMMNADFIERVTFKQRFGGARDCITEISCE